MAALAIMARSVWGKEGESFAVVSFAFGHERGDDNDEGVLASSHDDKHNAVSSCSGVFGQVRILSPAVPPLSISASMSPFHSGGGREKMQKCFIHLFPSSSSLSHFGKQVCGGGWGECFACLGFFHSIFCFAVSGIRES